MTRRRFAEDDSFFTLGNVHRFAKFISSTIDVDDSELEDIMIVATDAEMHIKCEVGGCNQEFSSTLDFEKHYRCFHQSQCSVCGLTFHNPRVLDIHIQETHDSYFKVVAMRKESYICLVEGCNKLFWDKKFRQIHLIETHKFTEAILRVRKKNRLLLYAAVLH